MSKNPATLARYALDQFLDLRGAPLKDGKIAPPEDLVGEKAELDALSFGDVFEYPHSVRGAWFDIGGERYICFRGAEDSLDSLCFGNVPEDFIEANLTGLTLLFLIRKLKMSPVMARGDDVEERVVGPARSADNVNLSAVLDFYPKLRAFKFQSCGGFKEDVSPDILALYLSTYHPQIMMRCQLAEDTLESLRRLISQDKSWIHKSNILDAMTASHLRHAFLEVYRCLEFAFVLPRAKELIQGISSIGGSVTENPIDFARRCADTLGWRRIERDSIESIFRALTNQDYSSFFAVVCACSVTAPSVVPPAHDSEKLNSAVSSVAQSYYNARNQVAHQFWPNQMKDMNDEDWNALIRLTAFCVENYQ